jgi:hypothetical protein
MTPPLRFAAPSRSIRSGRTEGSFSVGPRIKCPPALNHWVPGWVELDDNNISGQSEWYDKMVKGDCSGYTDDPDNQSSPVKRYIGVSLIPIVAGKYIDMIGAPAVGNQQAQFQAAVRLSESYDALSPASVQAFADHGTITLIDKEKSTYQFRTDRSGTHELRFEVLGNDGKVFHTDRVRIEIPGIPGVGR